MKLKFRADPEDWMIFGVFAVVLLYVIAIAVVNLSSFAADGTLSGLNPFPAFSTERWGINLNTSDNTTKKLVKFCTKCKKEGVRPTHF